VYKRLLLLNGLAALAIPMHHAAAFALLAMFQWTNRYRTVEVPNYDQLGSISYHLLIDTRLLMGFAIPAFLFVSGFFIAFLGKGKSSNVRWSMIFPRIKILLPPFIFWTVFHYLLIRNTPSSPAELLNLYFFIPIIIQFYLLSPLLVPLAKSRWKLLLVVSAFIHLTLFSLRYLRALGVAIPGQELVLSLTPRWLFIAEPFWFPLGLIIGLHLDSFGRQLIKFRSGLLVIMVILGLLTIVEYHFVDRISGEEWLGPVFGGIARIPYAIAVIFCVLAFKDVPMPYSNQISKIGTQSLGIYMANLPFIYVISSLMYHFTPWLLGAHYFYMFILFLAASGGPLLLMEGIRLSPIRIGYRYLFG
jgi:hypothetical protein